MAKLSEEQRCQAEAAALQHDGQLLKSVAEQVNANRPVPVKDLKAAETIIATELNRTAGASQGTVDENLVAAVRSFKEAYGERHDFSALKKVTATLETVGDRALGDAAKAAAHCKNDSPIR